MALDLVQREAFQEIQNELGDEGVDISIGELADVVQSQFVSGNLAFKKGLNVRLPFFGTFVRKHGLTIGQQAKELNALRHTMSEDEFKRKTLEAKLLNKEKAKQRRSIPTITMGKLKDTKNLVQVQNRYDKFL